MERDRMRKRESERLRLSESKRARYTDQMWSDLLAGMFMQMCLSVTFSQRLHPASPYRLTACLLIAFVGWRCPDML